MTKLTLASLSALALLGLAACSDTDNTTTESIENRQGQSLPTQAQPNVPTVAPGAQSGSGGEMPGANPGNRVIAPAPVSPAPAP